MKPKCENCGTHPSQCPACHAFSRWTKGDPRNYTPPSSPCSTCKKQGVSCGACFSGENYEPDTDSPLYKIYKTRAEAKEQADRDVMERAERDYICCSNCHFHRVSWQTSPCNKCKDHSEWRPKNRSRAFMWHLLSGDPCDCDECREFYCND